MLDKTENRMSTPEAVQAIADAFTKAEDHAQRDKVRFRGSKKHLEVIRDEHSEFGALECAAMASEMDDLMTAHEARLWALHSKHTKRAKELGIDLPKTRDGGDR